MAITATNEGKAADLPPAGNHIARCYSMIHIGTIKETIRGVVKDLNKVRVTWELPTEKKVFNPEKGEEPYTISKDYTLSMYEKSNLLKDLQSWRGKPFSDDEIKAFDVTKLLSVPCMLNIIHASSKSSGKEYATIASISGLPKGVACPPQINPNFEFSLETFDDTKFSQLPEWIRKKIVDSKEYKAFFAPTETISQPAEDLSQAGTDDGSDLPF